MCGIFGVVSEGGGTRGSLDEMIALGLRAIARRGPDGNGAEQFRSHECDVALAHTRLSIIDLSSLGQQPMSDDSSGWCIIYNGEIYNYLEIREELEQLGWAFLGHSDTEVLLKAWAHWGLGALERLNGMFAFAVFNSVSGELWLIRDRFGVKPLLWARLPEGGVVFSSSVAAVAELASADVDIAYCARGVRYKAWEVPGSEAPFAHVNSVSHGGWLKIQLSGGQLSISEGQWYDLAKAVDAKLAAISACSDEELQAQCAFLLEDSVKLRLRSDVPVAVSLSGGLDSSSIAACAARQVKDLAGFTYGSPSAGASEGPLVRDFSNATGIAAHYIWPSFSASELSRLLEEAFAFQEAPFAGLSVIAQNEVCRTVREFGFKVLLSGQGGDETFAGYRKFFVVALRDAMRGRRVRESLGLVHSLGTMLYHEAAQARMYWQNIGRYRQKGFEYRLLGWDQVNVNLWGSATTSLASRQIEDVQRWSIPSLLRYEDRNSMGHGVETRLPFMDYRLVELALALPARLKIARGFGKWMLRKVVDGKVPDVIRLNRKKRGFDVTQGWIKDGIAADLRSRILDNRDLLKQHLKGGIDLDAALSNTRLEQDRATLDEALMLAWLTKPIRLRKDANPS
jgi:asparagine synthase (glutamine-hydrolysing)